MTALPEATPVVQPEALKPAVKAEVSVKEAKVKECHETEITEIV